MLTVKICETEHEFDVAAAWRIIGEIFSCAKPVIGLSTGATTKNMHAIAADIFKQYPFDVSNVTMLGVDELTNLPRSYAGCCYTMLMEQIVGPLGISPENFLMPLTMSDDFEAECEKFQSAIEARGGVTLQILGLGANGHIGINQPGTPFESETWVSPMDEIFEAKVRRETNVAPDYPLGGLTLGIKTIMRSKRIILVAKGEHKAAMVKRMIYDPITPKIPATVLRLHPNCEFLLDKSAAKYLGGVT